MSSTFTTPIRVFKRNNPSNDGTIAPDNTGAAQVAQQQYLLPAVSATTASATLLTTADVGQNTNSAFVVPAGSIVNHVFFFQTTAPSALTGGVITVNIAGTDVGTITPTTTGGRIQCSFTATAAVATVLANVGTTDATITFTQATVSAITGTIAGTFDVQYTARNADGSITAYGSGYTNS
jgi:hypothetical protein